MKTKPIGILDSGIGGVSILNACVKIMPNENFVYIADNKFAPYGKRSKRTIKKRIEKLVFHLITEYHIKCLVIACNTASTISAKRIREKYTLPIIAIEPPTKLIKENNQKVFVMATKHTLKNKNVKTYFKNNKNAKGLAISSLAKEIDNNLEDFDKIIPLLEEKLKDYQDFDEVVIGCTHYSFIKEQIKQILPKTKIVSCENAVAKQVKKILSSCLLAKKDKSQGILKVVLTENNQDMENFVNKNYFDQLKNQK